MRPTPSEIIFIVRSYNELPRIPRVLQAFQDAGYPHVLVVDDGSKDGTADFVAHNFPQYTLLRHAMNRGAGAALETGFEYIRRHGVSLGIRYVFTFDADGQHTIDDVETFLSAIEQFPQVGAFLGSRFVPWASADNVPPLRKCILFGGRIFTWIVSGVWLSDAHNGFRAFRLDTLGTLYITLDGMEYASELVELLVKNNIAIHEVPVHIHYDAETLAKGQKSGNAINIAVKMVLKKFLSFR